ncbi:hypothetical protein RB653_009371 [Dictyostelium firmibasis]|uniref:Uncharacterized protein n=1 Tax=Dictyostelium firmibasis TaxID=79012 RepID=A0AAN7U1X9_9MYCE
MDNNISEIKKEEGVAIIGLGFRLPILNENDNTKLKYTPNSLWNSLMNKFDGVVNSNERWSENFSNLGEISSNYAGLIPLDEWKSFDPLFFGISPSEVPTIDPQQRVLLKCTWEALEDAMIDPIELRGSNTSVFIGSSTTDYRLVNWENDEIYPNLFGTCTHSIANRISYCFDFNGQSVTLDTACSSSLNSVQLGCSTIQNGTSNISIVGGVNLILDPMTSKSYSYLNMLSKTGRCKPFDESADGFVRGEGAGVVVLKSLKQAIEDGNNIYCIIKGSSSNIDGNGSSDKSSFYSPSSNSQADNIKLALKSTNGSVLASDIDYIEAHGTGTPTGDPIELEGISKVFKDHRPTSPAYSPLLIGSIKSNIGHCEAASGIASLIKCCLMFKNQCFLPNIHFKTPNPSIKFGEWKLKVVTDPIPFNSNKKVSMAVSNFGITGSNCCLILSQFNPSPLPLSSPLPSPSPQQQKLLIPFSANSVESLNQYKSIIESTNIFKDSEFIKFAQQQTQYKSKSLFQRLVVIAGSWSEFNDNSNQIKSSNTKSSNILLSSNNNKKNPITVFVFCGQSSQYNSMALELYNSNEIFKKSMDLLDGKLSKYFGYSVLNKLRSINDNDFVSIHDPIHVQPTICMVQVSLFQLYKHWGIEPSFIIGHSLGELTSAFCSGMMDLDTFCFVVYHRSLLQSSTNGCGKMLSISISADEFQSKYSNRYPSIEIACYNSPTSTVIGGNEKQLIEIEMELKEKGIFTAMLGSLSSFHTSSQLVTKEQILNLHFESKLPSIPTFSTTTSNLYDNNTFTAQHLFENILKPVYFTQTISNLYKHIEENQLGNEIVFIEIAPHPTLSFYLKQMIPKSSSTTSNYFKDGEFISIYSPLHKKKNDIQEINQMIANLYCQNKYNINFKCQQFHSNLQSNSNITFQLPLYQWEDQKYWKSSIKNQNHLSNGPSINHLGNINKSSTNIKSYETFIDVARKPFKYLKGHIVKGKYYFSGCGYIDNLLKMYPLQDITIDYLYFKTPLIFKDGVNQCLQTNIYQMGNSDYKIQFHFKDLTTNQWINCSNGNFQLVNHDTTTFKKKLNIENVLNSQCNLTKLSKNELYEYIKMKTGLTFNGYFQAVEQVYLGDGCSLSTLSTSSEQQITSTSFFNTPILDCCLHGMIVLIDEKCQIVFEKIEGFKYYSSNIPTNDISKCIYVYSKLKSRVGESYSASITTTLMDGTILFEIENATYKSLVPIKESLSIEYPTNELFTPYHQSIESLISTSSSKFHSLFDHCEALIKDHGLTTNDDTTQSLFEQEEFYKNPCLNYQHELLSNIIQECIKPIINEKMVFRILEFGGGNCLLSNQVLDRIYQLLEQNPSHEIDIEYTWSDISPSFITDAKNKLILKQKSNSNSGNTTSINIIYKVLDLEQPLIDDKQELSPSYYDIIIMSNILHEIKDIRYGINQIYDLLSPNGQLLFIEPSNRKDRCTMDQDSWKKLLLDCNFENITMTKEIRDVSICFLSHAQKPSLNSILSSIQIKSNVDENIIVYGDNNTLLGDNNGYKTISNIQIFSDLVKSSVINNQTIIYFTKSVNQLNLDNFKSITLEYIQINQILLDNKLNGCKHILLSLDSSSSNYLESSVIGSFKYFCEFPQLQLYSISLDSNSLESRVYLSKIIKYLITNSNKTTIYNEFIIKNNKVFYERYKQELKLKYSFKSSSFEIGSCNSNSFENLLSTLTSNLEYQLDSKQLKLKENEIEVKVMATGINYKDYLIYSGLVSNNDGVNNNKQNLGVEFSGIITRVGSNCFDFKIGDQVYGIGYNTTASHAVVDKRKIYFKPNNISHCEAASIPRIYLTNLYGIFNVGGLDIEEKDTILIHSAAGGIGLSALEILKWKGHKAQIFVTVGSKEKEQFLLDNYGEIITKIYSTNNRNYSDEIKQQGGVDLIINTLSSDFMDANFKCLATKGRIIDLSTSHLNYNEFTCNNKFKYNLGYHNIELTHVSGSIIFKLLKKLSVAIESGKLNLIPITQFSNSNIKEAIEYVGQRKHIGKIVVVNHNDIVKELIDQHSKQSKYSVLKSNYQINNFGRNIIITGQSGIALEILKWILEFGSHCIENIIILSKSSLKWELELLINKTINKANNKIKFHFKSVDVGNSELMNNTIDQILLDNTSITNIDSILHYAFIQIACKVNEIEMNHLDVSHGAKTMGAINLHNQSIKRGWKLLNFVMASSIASVIGSKDQCSYVSACNILDNLSKYRKSIGLPSTCINYGLIGSTGFVAKNESIAAMLDGEGIEKISTNKILGSLDLQIQNQQQSTNFVVCNFNFQNIKNKNQSNYQNILSLKFDYQINLNVSHTIKRFDLKDDINEKIKINDLFLNKVSELLSIGVSKINTGVKLIDYGADSLLIVQLKNWVDNDILQNIISIQQLQNNTIQDSIQIITNSYSKDDKTADTKATNTNSLEYWNNEAKLDSSIINLIKDKFKSTSSTTIIDRYSIIEKMNQNMVILLTGSSGFLGAYLLWHFIQLSNCSKIYCLIRNKSNLINPIDEIINSLKHHKLLCKDQLSNIDELISSKVQVIIGNLSKSKLGLSDQDYASISSVNLIVNSGADIDLKSNYLHSKQVNVDGLKEIIKLSVTGEIKCIVNFSSYAVFVNQILNQDNFDESITIPSANVISNSKLSGYVQSKIVAENLFMEASSYGIPSMLIRPPSIFSNSKTGIGSNNDIFLLLVQSCYAIGYYPNDIDIGLLTVPIDWCADKTIKIITNENLWRKTIPSPTDSNSNNNNNNNNHLNIFNINGELIQFSILFKYLENDFNCKGIEFNKWFKIMNESNNLSCIKLRSFHNVNNFVNENNFTLCHNFSSKTKSILESMNTYDGWLVTSEIVKNHINHIFKN